MNKKEVKKMLPIKDQEKRKAYFIEHLKDKTYDELAPVFGVKSGESVRSWAKRHKMPNKRVSSQSKRTSKTSRANILIESIKDRGYSEKEIAEIGYDFKDAESIAEEVEGYDTYVQRNEYNERVLTIIRQPEEKIEIKSRAYKYSLQEDGQPYMWIRFPKLKINKGLDKISLLPLADMHYGHKACDIQNLKQDIEYIRNHKNVYTFLNGDLIENASKLSIASGVYEQDQMPSEQVNDIVKMLAPIAHKILFSVCGN